jgi:uncharacterized membrane protein YfcA
MGADDSTRMHLSVATSLAVIVPTSIRSFLSHLKRGAVDTDLLRSFLFTVPAGVVIGSMVAAQLSSAGLRVIFAVVALVFGLKLLLQRDSWRLKGDIPGNPLRLRAFSSAFFRLSWVSAAACSTPPS